jgi:hypothetical protein
VARRRQPAPPSATRAHPPSARRVRLADTPSALLLRVPTARARAAPHRIGPHARLPHFSACSARSATTRRAMPCSVRHVLAT